MIFLTASKSFVTQKDFGVLGPLSVHADEAKDIDAGHDILEIKTIPSGFLYSWLSW